MKPPRRRLWKWLGFILAVVVFGVLFRSAVAEINHVPTPSMVPSILEGDGIFINKLAYGLKVPFTNLTLARWAAPKRGDVVILDSPADGRRLVKRVVALPGDRLELREDRLLVNGRAAEYVQQDICCAEGQLVFCETLAGRPHPVQVCPATMQYECFGPVTVPPGHYFVMGDNRDNSTDSRCFGFVPESLIQGRATAVAFSLDPRQGYRPRWGRFFTMLP